MRASVQTRSPQSLVHSLASALRDLMPSVRTADIEGVHQARVTTRRLREVLPLLSRDGEAAVALDTLKRLGRALGVVRELDVLDGSLAELEPRATFAGSTIAEARRQLRRDVTLARRKMIKTIEGLELECIARVKVAGRRSVVPFFGRATWRQHLEKQLVSRSLAVGDACHRAATVYMPNRSHAARIAIKRLRYSVEIAHETALWRPPRLLKDLRRVQESLGEIHDRQMLVERLDRLPTAIDDAPPVAWLTDLLRAEIDVRHRAFLAAISRLDAAIVACQHWAGHRTGRWYAQPTLLWPAAAVLVAPILLTHGTD